MSQLYNHTQKSLLSAAISKIAGTTTTSIDEANQRIIDSFQNYGFNVKSKHTAANQHNLITLKYNLQDQYSNYLVAVHINPRDGFITAKIE